MTGSRYWMTARKESSWTTGLPRNHRALFNLEVLESRTTPAFHGRVRRSHAYLSITGTLLPDAGTLGRDLAGNILLDRASTGATVIDTDTILTNTGDSQDYVLIDMTNGLLAPGVTAQTKAGPDWLIGVSAARPCRAWSRSPCVTTTAAEI
jgi:hypothetical protein